MMRYKTWKMLVAVFLTMCCLSGCSLAIEDAGTATSGDRLVGVFITDEALDLFDVEAYFEDHPSVFKSNEEVMINPSGKYVNKLYATIDKNESMDTKDWNISFEGVEGEYIIQAVWFDEDGEKYYDYLASDAVCDRLTNISGSDEDEDIEVSFTLYTQPGQEDPDIFDFVYYANPIYQTGDGEFYLVGDNFGIAAMAVEGDNRAITYSDQITTTEELKTTTEKFSVTVTYQTMYKPNKITLCQMDENHQLIKRDNYEPGKLPEKIQAEKDAAYFMIETEKTDGEGKTHIMREIYEPTDYEEEQIETFYPLDSGMMSKQRTEILWTHGRQ